MKKYLFLILFILSSLAFGQEQEYDVYVEYMYRTYDLSIDNRIFQRKGQGKIKIDSIMNFDKIFEINNVGYFEETGVLSATTTKTSLNFNGSLRIDTSPTSYSATDSGSLIDLDITDGVYALSSLAMNTPTGYFHALVSLHDKISLTIIKNPENCFKEKITVQASKGHPTKAYTWFYSADGYTERQFASNFSRINVSLEDLYPDSNDHLNLLDEVITFRIYNSLNDYYSGVATYVWSDCSPELIDNNPITTTDAICYGSDDGTATLTFKTDIAPESQMRFFVYEGDVPNSPTEENLKSENPEFPGTTKQTILDPLLTLTQTANGYMGTLNGLSGNSINQENTVNDFADYFIVYQEVEYNNGEAKVKSGEITPTTFRIHQPTQITLETAAPNFFTDASCGNSAIFNLDNTAMGGDNLDSSGIYSYQYSQDNGINWKPVDTPNNVLEIEAIDDPQSISVRGVYTIDGKSCVGEEYQFTIAATVPPVTFSSPSAGNTSTAGASDGSVQVEFSGGTPIYAYILTRFNTNTGVYDAISAPSNQVIIPQGYRVSYNNLSAGTYRIIVTDGNDCPQESPDLIVGTTPIPTLGTLTVTQMGCEGSFASISVPISDFNDNYRYQWIINEIPSAIQTGSDPNLVKNTISTPGTHILKVSNGRVSEADFNKDAYTTTTMVEIDNPITVIITNAIPYATQCENSNDGSISISTTGGKSYEYTLEFFPNETDWIPLTDNTITDLAPGRYRVTIRNQDGCESETLEDVNVVAAPSLEVSTSKTDVATNGGNEGTITLDITGGTPFSAPSDPYTISWEKDGAIYLDTDPSTPNFINELGAGVFTATVTDANGCNNTISITITEPGPLTILSFTGKDACNGLEKGTLTSTALGTGQLIFNWILNDGSPTGTVVASTPTMEGNVTLEGLSPGVYSLNIIEADSGNEANSTQDVIIAQTTPITATIATTESSCGNLNLGTITISDVSGGTPFPTGSGYEYHINDAFNNYQSDPQFTNLPPRSYIVTIRDAQGCKHSETVEITQAGAPVLDQTKTILTNPTSVGGDDGAIALAFITETTDYNYQWTGPGVNGVTTKDVTDLVAGYYQVAITSPDNCSLVSDFTISDPSPLQATITQTVLLECNGDDFAEITANIQDGTAPYAYEWFQITNGNTIPLSKESGIIGGLTSGTYFLQVTDANNNTSNTSPLTITQPDILTVQVDEVIDILCSGEVTGAINVSVSGGTTPYSYIWSNGDIDQNLSNVSAGEYTLEIMDANECFTEVTVAVNNAPKSIQITDVAITNLSDYMSDDGSISVIIEGGASPYSITWTKLSDNTNIGNQESISDLSSDTYQVLVSDTNGCIATEVYEVTQPDIVEETIIQPSCSGDSNGSISVLVNQDNGNFTYNWNTGATNNTIDNLSSGNYTVTITGFGDGPLTRTYVLVEPLPLEVDLGEARTLCSGQELVLDARVEDITASYTWTSHTGFTSTASNAIIKESGTYTITIITQNGCSATGSVLVETMDEEISAEFAMSSQVFVGESLIAVDISHPLPESQEWILPESATVVKTDSDEAELIFNEPGEYEIGIITKIGDCMAQQFKKVLVVANENKEAVDGNMDLRKQLEDFIIYPNPTNGRFTADIALSERGNISIKIFNFANNALMASKKERGSTFYSIPLDISGLPAGVYAVVLETPFGNSLRKVILK